MEIPFSFVLKICVICGSSFLDDAESPKGRQKDQTRIRFPLSMVVWDMKNAVLRVRIW